MAVFEFRFGTLRPPSGGGGFRTRPRIPPGHSLMFVGVWAWGVRGCGVAGLKQKTQNEKVMQVLLKNDARIDTHICAFYLKTFQNLKESKQGSHKSWTPEARTPGTE